MIVVFFFSVFVNVTECFRIIVCVLSDRGDNNSAAGRKSRSGSELSEGSERVTRTGH